MGETTIEWADYTFNPWLGCTKVSPACDHCYAESWARRTGQPDLWAGTRKLTSASNWAQPLKWDRKAAADGVRRRVFCASLADVFDNQVTQGWRQDLWALIADCVHLDWLLLTKRPQNIMKMLPGSCAVQIYGANWPWHHVWLGTTAENQEEADRRIPILLATPAAVRFVSLEPVLGPIDLSRWTTDQARYAEYCDAVGGPQPKLTILDWVIVGGESGPKARPMHPDWVRSIRDQCRSSCVPFLFKQWGEWHADSMLFRTLEGECPPRDMKIGKKKSGRTLDGVVHNAFPTGGYRDR